jgi:SAM-dependent methyltransferase/GNAT superfamily N-acetyltransferase
MNIELRTVVSDHLDLHELIAKLDRDISERYPKQGIFGIDFHGPNINEVVFIIAYVDGLPAGCGAIRPLNSDCVELKRFFVDKEYRNTGIASKMLTFLENKARELGYRQIKLETGPKQPEAINLYKKFGYREIERFGEYIHSEDSLCFAKELHPFHFNLLYQYAQKPALFEKSTASMWDDEHISKGMLEAHLAPEVEAASRKHAFIEASVDWIIRYTKLPNGAKILDLGCGPGLYSERFAKQGFAVTGIDFSRRSIEYAKQQAAQNHTNTEYIYQNYLTIDFSNEFDLIVLIYCDFGVFSDSEARILFDKVYSALKPGGYFIFDVFTPVKFIQCQDFHPTWEWAASGFWRPGPYVCLQSQHIYPENDTFMDQYVVMDEQDRIEVYRNWNQCYSRDTIEKFLNDNGFQDMDFFADVSGEADDDMSETLTVVARK